MNKEPPIHLWSIEAEMCALPAGNRNTAFRTLGLTPDLVFKSTTRNEHALAWLTEAHDAAEAAGFAVPRLISSAAGNLSENGWTAEPFFEGTPPTKSQMTSLVPLIRRMHDAAKHIAQRPDFRSARDFLHYDTGGDIDLSATPEALVELCRTAFAALEDRGETLVHGDLNRSNILRLDDGRFALLDWDEARRDHPIFDLGQISSTSEDEARALLAWEIACCWTIEPDRARRLSAEL